MERGIKVCAMEEGGTKVCTMEEGGIKVCAMEEGGIKVCAMEEGGIKVCAMEEGGIKMCAMEEGGTKVCAMGSYGGGGGRRHMEVKERGEHHVPFMKRNACSSVHYLIRSRGSRRVIVPRGTLG